MKEYQMEKQPMPRSMKYWLARHGMYVPKRYSGWRECCYVYVRHGPLTKYAHDRRRCIRVLPHINRMDICDGYFDRWANSFGAAVPIPRTEKEFENALNELHRLSHKKVLRIAAKLES